MAKRSIKKEQHRERSLTIVLPENVKTIIATLEEKGFEAFAVGGCVRDSLIGREPGDWDITTSALPQDIKAAFRRTVDTGIEHGTVTVMMGNDGYEVTTYRIDGEYKDGRHPSGVTFTDLLSEDLRRRDFTINAMAYNESRGLVDLFDGRNDLKRRVIRCVGNANERFDEDALRILRAVRFAAQLDFDIDSMTRDAISQHAPNLKQVSRERVLVEISKLICSGHIERIAEIFQLGIIPYVASHFREINIAQLMGLKNIAIRAEAAMAAAGEEKPAANAYDLCASTSVDNRYIRFAFLTEGMKHENVDEMLKDLKADNQTRRNSEKLAEWILKPLPADKHDLKEIMSGMAPELFVDLLHIKLASSETMLYGKCCKDEDIYAIIRVFDEIARNEEPVYLGDLAVTGADLKEHGVKAGPEMGKLLHSMLDHVWSEPEDNTKEILLKMFT